MVIRLIFDSVICTYKSKADQYENLFTICLSLTGVPFLTFQVSCHGFVSCRRHGWCDNATAQGNDNKWTVPRFGPPWHCSQACSSILFFCFNALRCLDSICQFVMFDDINSLNAVIYLSQKKKNQLRSWFLIKFWAILGHHVKAFQCLICKNSVLISLKNEMSLFPSFENQLSF